jgi:hypothetical protein
MHVADVDRVKGPAEKRDFMGWVHPCGPQNVASESLATKMKQHEMRGMWQVRQSEKSPAAVCFST